VRLNRTGKTDKKGKRNKMKKLMTIAAIVLMAAVSQAATFNWDWSFSANDADFNPIGGTVDIILGGSTIDTATFGTAGTSGNALAWNDGSSVYTMRFTTTLANSSVAYVERTFTTPATWAVNAPDNHTTMNSLWGSTYQAMVDSTGSPDGFKIDNYTPGVWAPIPEPSSMALLAIGAAALGFRRKFRK
jgi:hypothetical protein